MPFPASAWSSFAHLHSCEAGSPQGYRSDLSQSPLNIPLVKVAGVNVTSAFIIQLHVCFPHGPGDRWKVRAKTSNLLLPAPAPGLARNGCQNSQRTSCVPGPGKTPGICKTWLSPCHSCTKARKGSAQSETAGYCSDHPQVLPTDVPQTYSAILMLTI